MGMQSITTRGRETTEGAGATSGVARECELSIDDAVHRARRGLLSFTKYTKPDYEINWHHRLICHWLNKLERGEITRLIIEAPPRHGKSELVSRRFPAYVFGRNPDAHFISTCYAADLARSMSRDVQRIIDSKQYGEVFPETTLFGSNIRTVATGTWLRNADEFEIVGHRGHYRCAGVGGGITGVGGDYLNVDDPVKDQAQADSAVYQESVWDWYQSTLYTRGERNARILITMTRWHHRDLVGRLLKLADENKDADQWHVLRLPALNEDGPNDYDPRELGQALWPWKYDEREMHKRRASIVPRIWNALYQQRPAPQEGGIIKTAWLRFYTLMPGEFDGWGISADLTFKDGEKNDFAVFMVWGRIGADCYLLDMFRSRMGFTEQVETMRIVAAKWPQALCKWIEDAANGAALVSHLRSEIPGLDPIPPKGSKIARLEAVAPMIKSGNVYLPDSSIQSWVSELIDELVTFPNGANDDMVDALSLALSQIQDLNVYDWAPASMTKSSQFL